MNALGSNVLNAVRVLDALGSELEALRDQLEKSLVAIGDNAPVTFESEEAATKDNAYSAGGGWILDGYRWTFPARQRRVGRGRRARAGELSIAVDLGREARPARALGFPCMVVAWASAGESWSEELDGVDGEFWPVKADSYEIRAERLIWWIGTDDDDSVAANRSAAAKDASWLYVLPLFSVSSPNKLEDLVIRPVLNLLAGKQPEQVFAAVPEVVAFRWANDEAIGAAT